MNGQAIKQVLEGITMETLTNGSLGDLWSELPDNVAGSDWVGEIADSARIASDWLTDEDEYSEDKVSDLSYSLADSECEDYYSTINKRVQALALWASTELDDEVAELQAGSSEPKSLTDLNSLYLYAAMRGLYYTLLTYAVNKAEELEEVGA